MNWRKVAAGFTAALLSVTTASIFPTKTVFAADVCVIDTDTEHQMIRGFGGINHPEWAGDGGRSERKNEKTFNWQVDNILRWKKEFGEDHRVEATFLQNAEKGQWWKTVAQNKLYSPREYESACCISGCCFGLGIHVRKIHGKNF